MIEIAVGGFLFGIIFGMVARISTMVCLLGSTFLIGYSMGNMGVGDCLGSVWSLDFLVINVGFLAGLPFGYIAIDYVINKIATWMEEI